MCTCSGTSAQPHPIASSHKNSNPNPVKRDLIYRAALRSPTAPHSPT
jgi:hypothetical protein